MEQKKKFVLEFDEEPTFVYVAESPGNEHVYINGQKQVGWTSLKINTNMEELPTYVMKGYAVK